MPTLEIIKYIYIYFLIFYDYNLLFIVQSGDIIFCCHVSYDLIGASYPQATAQTTTRFIQKEKKRIMIIKQCHTQIATSLVAMAAVRIKW